MWRVFCEEYLTNYYEEKLQTMQLINLVTIDYYILYSGIPLQLLENKNNVIDRLNKRD
jgi:hypothetical protein